MNFFNQKILLFRKFSPSKYMQIKFGKIIHTSGDMLCNGIGNLISGGCQNAVEAFFHGHGFIFIHHEGGIAGTVL